MQYRRLKGNQGWRDAFFLAMASALLLVFPLPLLAQDKVSIPQPPPLQPRDFDPPKLEQPPRPRTSPGAPVAPITRPLSSLEELRKDVEQLQVNNNELQQAIVSDSAAKNKQIKKYAANIYEIAQRLQSGLWLSPSGEESQPENAQVATRERLLALASALNELIKAFISNPVAQQSHTVDAELLERAGLDLEGIIRKSAGIKKQAEELATGRSVAGRASNKASKPAPYLRLDLDCGVWTTDLFADRPAKIENLWPRIVEGIEVQVRHHELRTEQLFFLDECLTAQARQQAAANGERYAATIKGFNSYEVKGRAFAYEATYEVVRTRSGKINLRLGQLVVLFYTDEGGSGVFDLYQGNMPLRFLPEWAKKLAVSRP